MAKRAKKTAAKKATKKAAKKVAKKASTKSTKPSRKKDDCFITTACVEHYSLSDNCFQLRTLREFRDNILSKSSAGRDVINEYYLIAPRIVAVLKKQREKDKLFKNIFSEINKACKAIEDKRYLTAITIYANVTSSLANYFNIDHGSKR